MLKAGALLVGLVLGAGAVVFHPSRPLYMRQRDIAVAAGDGAVLRGTLSIPRWRKKPVPAVVVVHGSGRLTRQSSLGDVRGLVKRGVAVMTYDKRGVGESTGEFLQRIDADTLLRRLARDAAAIFDSLSSDRDVDTTRLGFFGGSQAGWIIPIAAGMTRVQPRFLVIASGPAVSTGVEQFYSDMTSDGTGPLRVADPAEIERRVLSFDGRHGFDPLPFIAANRVPTLWLLGDRDLSVPTFASVRVLDSLKSAGNTSHTIIRYPNADHELRDVGTRELASVWDDMMSWLTNIGVMR